MDALLAILPNLSIGVVAILGLVLVIRWFLLALQTIITSSQKAMKGKFSGELTSRRRKLYSSKKMPFRSWTDLREQSRLA